MHLNIINRVVVLHKIIIFLSIILLSACSENKIYFDNDWKETTKSNASFYREIPVKENALWLIKDYYITGEKQFTGYAKDSLAAIFDGNATWYTKTGKVQNKIRYSNGKIIGEYVVKHGAIGSSENGWDEDDLIFIDDTKPSLVATATDESKSVYAYFYTNSSQIASEHFSYTDKNSFTIYYNNTGDTIARLDYNTSSEKWSGKEVNFYELEKRGKNDMISIKEISVYTRGIKTQTAYYNPEGQLIAQASLKDNLPFQGTYFVNVCLFYKIQEYINGSLQKETTYNKDNTKIAEINFKNNVPNTGVYYNCSSMQTYKDGQLHGKSIDYIYDDSEIIGSEFVFKKGKKDGKYIIYQDESLPLEKGTYKNGIQKGEVIYYHNGHNLEDEIDDNYYLKASVKSSNNKMYISKLYQYSLDEDELLKTFEFEKNDTDKFTYINNGYHSISFEDLNSDSHEDLKISYNHYLHDISTITYYVFNPKTNKYSHLEELDNNYQLEINSTDKTVIATTIQGRYEDQTLTTYKFLNIRLEKKFVIENVYHQELDSTITTQVFPIDVDKYPLLADNLPPAKFVQSKSEQLILDKLQNIKLKKAPFAITFPGIKHGKKAIGFNLRISASYSKDFFDRPIEGYKIDDTTIFSTNSTIAVASNAHILFLEDDGHNLLYYDDTPNDDLDLIKKLEKNVLLLQFSVDEIHDGISEKTIAEIDKPVYMIMYIDKNQNQKIDENEIHYITLEFED